jgi:dTDP-4-dehydrorhamnose reductase
MTRIALIGSGGQLGDDLLRRLAEAGGWEVLPFDRQALDCTNGPAVRSRLIELRPEIVVNCAAYVRVDEAESDAEETFRVNAIGARHVAAACAALGALCVQVSTDFVFDGEKGTAYTEQDVPRPINVYGASKYAGELLVQLTTPRHLIVRTAGLFGTRPSHTKRSFIETVLDKASRGEALEIVDDVRTSPTFTRDLAAAIDGLLNAGARGIVHVTNAGDCTWYEFAKFITSGYPDARITPAYARSTPAKRPPNTALASARLNDEFGMEMRSWQDAVSDYLRTSPLERRPT